jgi:queuine tRNA-ribosyltransferase
MDFFELQVTDPNSRARAGVVKTDHGDILTPIFMPVGTIGSVKAVKQEDLEEMVKAQIILGNTYHLYLRPGMDLMRNYGGLHQFMQWDRPILTDSGGYQVFSLAHRRKIKEEGVTFASHIDGSKHLFTPENVMEIQTTIGSDILMAFDECPPYPAERKYVEQSMHLTHRWLKRCIANKDSLEPLYGHRQHLFPIVQGGVHADLRAESCKFIADQGQPGNAIGGLSVGEPAEMMYTMTEICTDILPKDRPRYLMGVGTPANLLECIERGIDMFDCVMPTRNARNGNLFTRNGIINIKNKKWQNVQEPIDALSNLPLDHRYSLAYLRHLFAAEEMLGPIIASIHNLSFYLWLVGEARNHILAGDFVAWKNSTLPQISQKL